MVFSCTRVTFSCFMMSTIAALHLLWFTRWRLASGLPSARAGAAAILVRMVPTSCSFSNARRSGRCLVKAKLLPRRDLKTVLSDGSVTLGTR